MITTIPAVQLSCKRIIRGYICFAWNDKAHDKRVINRQHRRYLNALTRTFVHDPDLFDDEPFDAPTLSVWDYW